MAVALAAVPDATCGGGGPPRIGYPAPWLGPVFARVARAGIDRGGGPPAVELLETLPPRRALPPGYAGDVAFAEATVKTPNLVAAVGPMSSRATLLAAPVYTERRIPLIVPTATSSLVGALGPWVFQLPPNDRAEGAFMADFALDRLHARRVTIFYLLSDEYGLGLKDGILRALRGRGVAPVDEAGIIEESDFPRRVAESLRRARPDVVVIAARGPEAAAITRALEKDLPGTPVIVGDGAPLNAAFLAAAGPAAASVYGVAWWLPDLPDTAARDFVARWERAGGTAPSASDAMYYDAVMVAARAVRAVGPHRLAIRRYLSELGTTRPPYRGVTGLVSFAPDRTVNLLMTAVSPDGRVVVVPGPAAGR